MNLSMGELSTPHKEIDIIVLRNTFKNSENDTKSEGEQIKKFIKETQLRENEGLKNINIQISQDIHNKDWNIVTITATKVEFIKNTY